MSTSLLFSLVLASATPTMAEPPIPENLRDVPEASFSKEFRSNEIANQRVLRLVKANKCTPQDVGPVWDGMKVVALMLVNSQGRVEKISPVSVGCPAVEDYGVKEITKHVDRLTSRPRGEDTKWYRTSIVYYW